MAGHLWCSTGAKACQGEELLGEDSGHVGVDGSLSHEGHLIHLFEDSISLLVQPLLWDQNVYMYKNFKFFTKASIKIRVKNIMMNFISTFAILKLILKLFTSNIQRHLRVLPQEADRWRRGRRKTAAWHIADTPRSGGIDLAIVMKTSFPSEITKFCLNKRWNNFWKKVLDNLLASCVFFVSYWFALQFILFFSKRKWKALTAWLKWWEISTCGHSEKVTSSRDTILPSFCLFFSAPHLFDENAIWSYFYARMTLQLSNC